MFWVGTEILLFICVLQFQAGRIEAENTISVAIEGHHGFGTHCNLSPTAAQTCWTGTEAGSEGQKLLELLWPGNHWLLLCTNMKWDSTKKRDLEEDLICWTNYERAHHGPTHPRVLGTDQGTGTGALWPGWTLTLPAQHLNLHSKAARTGKLSTAPFIFHYFYVLKSLLGEENQ